MIAIITLIMMISAYMIANALSRTTAEVNIERAQYTMEALRQAKSALIAYAASEQWQKYKSDSSFQPGALPCPDQDGDGDSDCYGSTTSSQIGRLPWKTLGINDVRDASGQRPWYALSYNFRKLTGSTVINSDTEGQLTITGTAPATKVVAIVFAPGQALQNQNRNPGDSAAYNNPANYLEGFDLSDPVHFKFTTNSLSSDTLNDRLLAITQADVMSAVEPVVAASIERDVKPLLSAYFTQWGAYPFPSAFANPDPGTNGAGTTRAQSAYQGNTAQVSGLLPVSASLSYPWTDGSGSVVSTGGIGTISNVSCAAGTWPFSGWQCSFTLRSINLGSNPLNWGPCTDGYGVKWRYCVVTPRFKVQGEIGPNAGISFAKLPDADDVTVTSPSGSVARPMEATTLGGTLSPSGAGTVRFEGTHTWTRYDSSSFTRSMRVVIPDATVSPFTSASDTLNPTAYWFIANEWYRQTYYAVSPGYLPGGGGSCTARPTPPAAPVSPSCLLVGNLRPTYTVANDKRAIVILAGRSLNGTARPSASIGNYMEGANVTALTTTPYAYENRSGAPTSINDRVVVVSP